MFTERLRNAAVIDFTGTDVILEITKIRNGFLIDFRIYRDATYGFLRIIPITSIVHRNYIAWICCLRAKFWR